MEFRHQISRLWFQKIAIFVIFSLFTVSEARAGLIVPTITVQPVGTNVQNGDTATFNISASCLLSLISSVTWYCNSNVVQTTAGLSLGTINSTLTLNKVSSANAGKYYAVIEDLLGGTVTSSKVVLDVLPPATNTVIIAIPAGTGMVTNGFKLEFSAPTGSNVVIQASSDLSSWSSISTNVAVGGSVSYTDTAAKTVSCRFYRAMMK
jgi:hypothetical protein